MNTSASSANPAIESSTSINRIHLAVSVNTELISMNDNKSHYIRLIDFANSCCGNYTKVVNLNCSDLKYVHQNKYYRYELVQL